MDDTNRRLIQLRDLLVSGEKVQRDPNTTEEQQVEWSEKMVRWREEREKLLEDRLTEEELQYSN